MQTLGLAATPNIGCPPVQKSIATKNGDTMDAMQMLS